MPLPQLIAAEPGLPQNQVIAKSGIPQKNAVKLLRKYTGSHWNVDVGARGALRYFPLADQDPSGERPN